MKTITVRQRVAELVRQHGSYRKAAAATGVDPGVMHHIVSGYSKEENLTLRTVRGLGLKCGPDFEKA